MTRAFLLASTALIGGCAMPQYATRFTPFGAATMPVAQMEAICRPQAQMAGRSASADTQARIDAQNSQVTGYDCSTTGYATGPYASRNYNERTRCTPRTGGPSSLAAGIAQGLAPGISSMDAHNAVLTSCAAQHGYRLERVCVANCGDSRYTANTQAAPIAARPSSDDGKPATEAELRQATGAELCYRAFYQRDPQQKTLALRLAHERGVRCFEGSTTR